MNQVGELIRESIEATEREEFEKAFAAACAALKLTLEKSLETEALALGDYQNFVKQYWWLLSFTGLPRALPLPPDINNNLNELFHGFRISGAEQLVLHLIRQTVVMRQTPFRFKFHKHGEFELRGNQIYVPQTLIGGLISLVIFQPVNKGETVPDKFWINVADFRMFISELWGRIDLAERIVDLYN